MFVGSFEATLHNFYTVRGSTCARGVARCASIPCMDCVRSATREPLIAERVVAISPRAIGECLNLLPTGEVLPRFSECDSAPMQFDMLERFVWVVLSHRALLLSRLRPVTAPLFCTTLSPSVAWSRRSATVESRPICQSAASDGATAIAGPHRPGHRPRADSACMVRVPRRTHGVRWQVLTGVTA